MRHHTFDDVAAHLLARESLGAIFAAEVALLIRQQHELKLLEGRDSLLGAEPIDLTDFVGAAYDKKAVETKLGEDTGRHPR